MVVEVVVDVDVVVDVVVEVDVDVVTGTVVVVADAVEVDVLSETDEEVEPTLVGLVESLPHDATTIATTSNGARRVGFTVGSLARVVAIT